MKKINSILSVLVLVAVVLSSCNQDKAKSVSLKNDLDSLNYALGYANGKIIKDYHLRTDSAGEGLKELLAGIHEGLKAKKEDKDMQAITEFGKSIGSQLKTAPDFYGDSSLTVDYTLIRQGLINGIMNEKMGMEAVEAQTYFNRTLEAIHNKRIEAQYKDNKVAGQLFLAENAKKEGVVVTASGLQYEVIKQGKGPVPTETDKVKVHYHGTLIDGTVFDSSVDRKEPVDFGVTQVIKGWTEALQLMPVGSKYKLYIPEELAYGAQNRGKILPFSALIFDVELISIEK